MTKALDTYDPRLARDAPREQLDSLVRRQHDAFERGWISSPAS
jgi:hypothetical protein